MLFRPMMLRAASAGAPVAKYRDSFEATGDPNATGNKTIPAGWTGSQGTQDGVGYGDLGQVTTSPFDGSMCVTARGNQPSSSLIQKQFDLTGCTQYKLRVACTTIASFQSQSPIVRLGGGTFTSTGGVGLVSATNTGKTAPTGTWWELLFSITDRTANYAIIGSDGGTNLYFDLLEIF